MMYKDFGTDMVTIEVGQVPDTKKFRVHKNIICRSSDYFSSAFEATLINASNQHLRLPEEHADVFEAFCDWLYSGKIRDPSLHTGDMTPSDLFWLRVYTMADRYNDIALHDLAASKITTFDQSESIPSASFIAELFQELMPNKFLEHYVVRHVAAILTTPHADWKL